MLARIARALRHPRGSNPVAGCDATASTASSFFVRGFTTTREEDDGPSSSSSSSSSSAVVKDARDGFVTRREETYHVDLFEPRPTRRRYAKGGYTSSSSSSSTSASREGGRRRERFGAATSTDGFAYDGAQRSFRLSKELNSEIMSVPGTDDILEHVRTRAHLYNNVNCATAWHRLAKRARAGRAPRGWRPGKDGRVKDLEDTTRRLIQDFQVQNLANFVWSCATLNYQPRGDLIGLAVDEMEKKTDEFYPQAITNTLWAFTIMKHPRGPALAETLAPVILKLLPDMDYELKPIEGYKDGEFSTQTVSNALWAYATMNINPGAELLDRLGKFVEKNASNFKAQELSNSAWSFMVLNHHPGNEILATFEQSLLERMEECTTQALANTSIALAFFGGSKDEGLKKMFDAVNPTSFRLSEGNTQDISNIIWAMASVGAFETKLYKAAVRELFRRDLKDFVMEGQRMLYHTRLMQYDYDPTRKVVDVVFPDWVEESCRTAWLEQAKETRVSTFQERVAETIQSLGFDPIVEHVTDDGLMSLDICVDKHKLAVECDGPSHFYSNLTETVNQKTKLRDAMLAKRGWTVVSVPYHEWHTHWAMNTNKEYMKGLLAVAGVAVE